MRTTNLIIKAYCYETRTAIWCFVFKHCIGPVSQVLKLETYRLGEKVDFDGMLTSQKATVRDSY